MNIIEIMVPDGIRYLGQWEKLGDMLPDCHFILDKSHTGVGATQYFLTNKEKVILCSPRCSLIENKRTKHPDAWVFRDISDNAVIDDGGGRNKKRKKATYEELLKYKDEVVKYAAKCMDHEQTPKIMVTYDSLEHVVSALQAFGETELDSWTLVVDEFQQIFCDSAFKSLTEMMFLDSSQYFKRVIFLSATPYLNKYMEFLDEFKNLPYYKLIWPKEMEEQMVVTNITIKPSETRTQVCRKIINKMKTGKTVKLGNIEIDTSEAVFYLNNVKDIIQIIRSCGLSLDEVNILCSQSSEDKLKKAGLALGNFPAEGEKHKPFTFCTRSVYLGVDFYSECAVSYIFADPTQQTLALDISTDLPQILGRQRLDRNPYRNQAFLFVKENSMGLNDEEFNKYIGKKASDTRILIDDFKSKSKELQEIQLKKYRTSMEVDKYKNDYLIVVEDKKTGKATVQFNTLCMLAEMRAWEISKKNLSSQYSIIREQRNAGITAFTGTQSENPDVLAFKKEFEETRITNQRIRIYCDFRKAHPELIEEVDFISPKYARYWDALGYDGLKSLGFEESKIISVMKEPVYDGAILEEVTNALRNRLKERRYESGQLKKIMAEEYRKAKYIKSAKACDIVNFMTAKPFQNYKTGKKGFEILSLYQKCFSLFPLVSLPNRPMDMNIDRFLDIVQTGMYTIRKSKEDTKGIQLKDIVGEIRRVSDHDKQNTLKKEWLPVGCINGVFRTKHVHGLETFSSFMALDYDKFTSKDEMSEAKDELKKFPFIYAIYETPSGLGLKAIILHDLANPDYHWNLYLQLAKICYLPQIDNSVSDLSRGHYLSYDPDLWRNPNPETYHFVFDPTLQPAIKEIEEKETKDIPISMEEKYKAAYGQISSVDAFLNHLCHILMTNEAIMDRLDYYWKKNKAEYFKEGNRHNGMLTMSGTMCKAGIPMDMASRYLHDSYKDMEHDEIENVLSFAYERNPFGCDRRFYGKKKYGDLPS